MIIALLTGQLKPDVLNKSVVEVSGLVLSVLCSILCQKLTQFFPSGSQGSDHGSVHLLHWCQRIQRRTGILDRVTGGPLQSRW